MKHVFIHAFAATNLGDDLMMRILCERYPNVGFRLYADQSYRERFADIPNLKIYAPSDSWVACIDCILNKVKKTEMGFWKLLIKVSDVTVHIGGSVFTQHQDDYSPALNLDTRLRYLSKKLYVVGANFGPFVDPQYYEDYQELLSKYEDVCFRDSYSYELHKNLPNVRYAPDVVFNQQMESVKEVKKQVLISMIDMEQRGGKYSISQYTKAYEHFVLQLTKEYIMRGYDVVFASFCAMQGDERVIARVQEQLDEQQRKKTGSVCYDKNMKECLQAFAESELIVGTRFHSIIIGWIAGRKVLPIVYDNKTLYTLEDNKITDYLTLEQIQNMGEAEIVQIADKLEAMEPFDAGVLKEKAAEQFAGLDQELQK